MPNWVRNQVTITGAPEKVEALKKQVGATTQIPGVEYVRNEDGTYLIGEDGNMVLKDTVFSDENPVFSFWNIVRPTTPEELETYKSQGWYDWNINNWGCKWDAKEVEEIDDSEGHWHIAFDTPWGSPTQAFQALSVQNPDVMVHVEWTEEQGFGAEETFEAGEVDVLREWNIPESHEQYEEVFGEESCYCTYAGDDVTSYPYEDCPRHHSETELAVAELEKVSELI
jgi:hypothetical protein